MRGTCKDVGTISGKSLHVGLGRMEKTVTTNMTTMCGSNNLLWYGGIIYIWKYAVYTYGRAKYLGMGLQKDILHCYMVFSVRCVFSESSKALSVTIITRTRLRRMRSVQKHPISDVSPQYYMVRLICTHRVTPLGCFKITLLYNTDPELRAAHREALIRVISDGSAPLWWRCCRWMRSLYMYSANI